jgi:hypothetical protein
VRSTRKKHYFLYLKSYEYKNRIVTFIREIWKNESGLGLIEMAIVLIIIGVFLSGVVSKGRKIISDAKLITTVGEISQYARALSDFMKNKGVSSTELLTNKKNWSAILGKETPVQDNESANKSEEEHSPALSNGGYLFIEDKEGICYLFLGKKGKKVFMTYHEASFLKDRLGDGVEIIAMDGKSIDSKSDQGAGMFCLKIPVD